ncbi:hypothetical protein WMF04_50740 [Sorangium sp. So ce260]|uniref:hypothetical protein n=1 Tax=Sorangium sp. So ce260 TaxID=3133291 RepID=UPI003F5D976F
MRSAPDAGEGHRRGGTSVLFGAALLGTCGVELLGILEAVALGLDLDDLGAEDEPVDEGTTKAAWGKTWLQSAKALLVLRTRCRAPNACASSPRGAAGPKRDISSISGRGIETCGASPVRSFANSASTAGAIDALGARRWRRVLACMTGGRTCAPIAQARA